MELAKAGSMAFAFLPMDAQSRRLFGPPALLWAYLRSALVLILVLLVLLILAAVLVLVLVLILLLVLTVVLIVLVLILVLLIVLIGIHNELPPAFVCSFVLRE